jgi:hypothetical protein
MMSGLIRIGMSHKGVSKMNKLKSVLVIGFIAAAFVAVPFVASARVQDSSNSGVCKSGKRVANVKNCKENGGKD